MFQQITGERPASSEDMAMGYTIYSDKILFTATGGIGTFQDAINQAQTSQLPLMIAPGNYPTDDLVISASVEIYAMPGTVTLTPSSSSNGFNLDIRSDTFGAVISDVTIRGVSLWGAGKPFASAVDTSQRYVYGLFAPMDNFNAIVTAQNVTRLIVEDCQIGGSGSNGLAMWNCTAEVRNNDFEGHFLHAIYAIDGWSTVIADNFVRDGQNGGIYVARSANGFDGTIIRGNRVHNTQATWNTTSGQVSGSGWLGNAIYCFQAADVVIADNICFNQTFSGIRLLDCWNCNIVGNQIYQSGETALFVEAPNPPPQGTAGDANPLRYEGAVVADNTIVNAGAGVVVGNGWNGGRRATISGNQIKSISVLTIRTNDPNYPSYLSWGTGIFAENDCMVSGNTVEDCASAPGIALISGGFANSTRKSATSAVGNIVKASQIGVGFFKEGPYGYTMISGNMLEGYSNGAIVPVTVAADFSLPRVAGSTDYGTTSGGLYTGKPFANVMIGLNHAI